MFPFRILFAETLSVKCKWHWLEYVPYAKCITQDLSFYFADYHYCKLIIKKKDFTEVLNSILLFLNVLFLKLTIGKNDAKFAFFDFRLQKCTITRNLCVFNILHPKYLAFFDFGKRMSSALIYCLNPVTCVRIAFYLL